ncbi:MAG: hypothetical protein JOZ54_18505, partial [Acidobacteria bacterium]|nr:hypothetical protein [Acidobacteriota bacterium]
TEFQRTKRELMAAMQPGGLTTVIRLLDRDFAANPISIRSLFRDEQRRILNILCNATLKEAESALRQLHERYDPLMRFHSRLGVPLPKVLQTAAEFDVNLQVRRLVNEDTIPLPELEARIREAREERLPLDETTLMVVTRGIERYASRFADDPANVDLLEGYEGFVGLVRSLQLAVDLREPQNDYYRMKTTIRPAITAHAGNGSSDAHRWLDLFDSLGEQLSISAEAGA